MGAHTAHPPQETAPEPPEDRLLPSCGEYRALWPRLQWEAGRQTVAQGHCDLQTCVWRGSLNFLRTGSPESDLGVQQTLGLARARGSHLGVGVGPRLTCSRRVPSVKKGFCGRNSTPWGPKSISICTEPMENTKPLFWDLPEKVTASHPFPQQERKAGFHTHTHTHTHTPARRRDRAAGPHPVCSPRGHPGPGAGRSCRCPCSL